MTRTRSITLEQYRKMERSLKVNKYTWTASLGYKLTLFKDEREGYPHFLVVIELVYATQSWWEKFLGHKPLDVIFEMVGSHKENWTNRVLLEINDFANLINRRYNRLYGTHYKDNFVL
jgi:hypothetical protein